MSSLANLVAEDFGVSHNTPNFIKGKIHDSIVVDKRKNVFYWNSQGIYGNIFTYLVNVRGWSISKAKEYLSTNCLDIYLQPKLDKTNVKPYPPLVTKFFLDGLDKREYYYKRGLTDETINMFLFGYYNGWSAIPIFESGKFMNFHLRRDNPKMFSAYYRGMGGLIFNIDIIEFVNEIFITEGSMDAAILIQNGIPAISPAGGSIQAKHLYKFKNIKRINILFDNDEAGRKEAKRTAKILGTERCYIYTFSEFPEKYDPVDFFRDKHTKEELLNLVYGKGKKIYD